MTKTKHSKSTVMILLGLLSILAAGVLIACNAYQNQNSAKQARTVLEQLNGIMPESQPATTPLQTTLPTVTDDLYAPYEQPEETLPPEPQTVIDGKTYIGVIEIPALNLRLPVLSQWSYPNLKISPCRYMGRADTDDLILAAHNYRSHFGRIANLNIGDALIFCAVDGTVYRYTVSNLETLRGNDTELLQSDADDAWDLTLFTCTLGGKNRVCVRAELID
ncbi:MAG: sortase [Oscillospiraceae bacterium]